MPGCFGYPDDGCGRRGNRHGQSESFDAAEAVTNALGEQDVGTPPHRCTESESDTSDIDGAEPGLGEQHDAQ